MGLEHLDTIYQAILKQIVLEINYQSFKARTPSVMIFTPYILKEFNNRWFVVGRKIGGRHIITLALDRVLDIAFNTDEIYDRMDFDPSHYYENTIGVSVLGVNELYDIELRVDKKNAPYVLTKPFHSSQEMIGEYPNGDILISIRVHLNFELERLILGFGDSITVLKPRRLRRRIRKMFESASENYNIYASRNRVD